MHDVAQDQTHIIWDTAVQGGEGEADQDEIQAAGESGCDHEADGEGGGDDPELQGGDDQVHAQQGGGDISRGHCDGNVQGFMMVRSNLALALNTSRISRCFETNGSQYDGGGWAD